MSRSVRRMLFVDWRGECRAEPGLYDERFVAGVKEARTVISRRLHCAALASYRCEVQASLQMRIVGVFRFAT